MSLTGATSASTFQRIVWTAVAAGVLAGLVLTGVQKMQVSGIILQAEVYEEAAAAMQAPQHTNAVHAQEHEMPNVHDYEDSHEHAHAAWQPADGIERTFFTALANVSMGVAFGLLLGAAFCLRGDAGGWRAGLLWGVAAYVTFFLAPSFGLPPEVPGTAAPPLGERQLWWAMTVLITGTGLLMLRFAAHWPIKLLGALVLFIPHCIGAPQVPVPSSSAPIELARAFVYASAVANAAFWIVLGTLAGVFYKKSA